VNEISLIFDYLWKYRWQDIPPTEPNLNITTRDIHKKGYRISILTKRYRSSVTYVAEWLDTHNIYCDDLIFIFDGTPKATLIWKFFPHTIIGHEIAHVIALEGKVSRSKSDLYLVLINREGRAKSKELLQSTSFLTNLYCQK